jgi:hypothetical protein
LQPVNAQDMRIVDPAPLPSDGLRQALQRIASRFELAESSRSLRVNPKHVEVFLEGRGGRWF